MTNVTVRVPITIRTRGGRKLVVSPDGTVGSLPPPRARIDSTLITAVARAFRRLRMLETGRFSTITELAAAEKINASSLSHILRQEGMTVPGLMEEVEAELVTPQTRRATDCSRLHQ